MLFLLLVLTQADTARTVRIPVAPAETLSVTMVGEGPAVVLIPGLFGSCYGFRHVMVRLDSTGYRAVCIEPLGMGSSSRPEGVDYSLTAQSDRIAVAMDTLGVDRAVLVGHSLGASIAMRGAYRHPELVRGIVSIEGGPGETATTKSFRTWIRFAPVARMLDVRGMMRQALYREMMTASFDDSWVNDTVVQAYTTGLTKDYRATIRAYQGMAKSDEPELLQDHLGSIRCPVVLLVGDTKHDSGPPSDEVELLVARLPSFAIDTVAQSGFFIQEEQPTSVADAVDALPLDGYCGQSRTMPGR